MKKDIHGKEIKAGDTIRKDGVEREVASILVYKTPCGNYNGFNDNEWEIIKTK